MPEIVKMPSPMAGVPAMLRQIAAEIESGLLPPARFGVLVLDLGKGRDPIVYGLGPDSIPPNCVWAMEKAKDWLIVQDSS